MAGASAGAVTGGAAGSMAGVAASAGDAAFGAAALGAGFGAGSLGVELDFPELAFFGAGCSSTTGFAGAGNTRVDSTLSGGP